MDQENNEITKVNVEKSKKKLIRGDYGLPATFWGWGVGGTFAVGFFIGSILDSAGSDSLAYFAMGLFFCYLVFISIAIWLASNQYKGPAHWGVLAKVSVILTFSLVSLIYLYLIAMLASPPMH